jgi:peptidoglycan hydrolase-like protein with peptidoglycan-binding domain
MKTMMRNGNKLRRSVSLLLMMSLLIALLPSASVAASTVGPYGSCTVTTKNVVIRSSPAGSRTGYFAQPGTYPMIGPVTTIDGTDWYNIQTSVTAGYVSGAYATASYGSAGMPGTSKIYTYIQANVFAYKNGTATVAHHEELAEQVPIDKDVTPVLQLVTGTPYTVSGVDYIDIYYNNIVHHTVYNANIANGIMTQDNLNDYIYSTTWKAPANMPPRQSGAWGDYYTHAIQAALYVTGYYDGDIDGNFGPETVTAINKFRVFKGWGENPVGPIDSVGCAALFSLAIDAVDATRENYGLGTLPAGTTQTMIQTTIDNLKIRKSYSTSSAYVGMIPSAGTILTYTRTQLSGTVTWYYIQYDGTYGWVMGTYVSVYTVPTGGTTTTPTITNFGTATITKKQVAIRTSPNGSRSGYHVNTGDVCTLLGLGVKAGGYTWYNIRTESGRTGYVRGDCCDVEYGSAGMPDTNKRYVSLLYDTNIYLGDANGGNAELTLKAAIDVSTYSYAYVLQLVTGNYYTVGGKDYIDVYYDNQKCHVVYTNGIEDGIMTQDNTNNYISQVVWDNKLDYSVIIGRASAGGTVHTGDIRVHAVQAALYQLEYLDKTDDMDGMFGSATATAVKKFKTDYGVGTATSENVGTAVSQALFEKAKAALNAKLVAASGTDTGDGTVPSAGNFGAFSVVKRGSWAEIDGGSVSLFPKGTVATVMSVTTKQVFRIYRWSGANHADCVPYDTSDTATLCSIVSFTYNSSHPTSSQLSTIKSHGNDDYPLYTWPDFRGGFGSAPASSSGDYKIPVWINLNGTVYCASIYFLPHGFNGTSGFSLSKLNGQYYYERNNMYGMMCVHFYGSTTHSTGTVNATHMTNINTAYNTAKTYSLFSGKVK